MSCWGQKKGQGPTLHAHVHVHVCVSSWVCRINLHSQVPLRINTHTQEVAAPSAFDMGELNDRGGGAKGKASSCPPPPLTALSGIDVPYGDLWTDFQISSRSGTQSIRPQDAVLYALTSVIWLRGWNNQGPRCTCTCPRDENHRVPSAVPLEDT